MRYTTALAIVSALFLAAAARAQSSTPPAPQPAYSTLDSDPAFKRLPPDEQEWIRKTLEKVHTAIAQKDTAALDQVKEDIAKHQAAALASMPASQKASAPAATPAPGSQPTPSGCTAGPVKKPGFHIPKALQNAIDKRAKQIGKQTGVDVDPNAPAKAVKDAQKNIPCPPAIPAPGQPAASK